MKEIRISSPGKLLILGEHSVVYNRPSIVTTVDTRVYAILEKNNQDKIIINAPGVGIRDYKREVTQPPSGKVPKGVRFLEAVLKIFYKKYQPNSGVNITTHNGFSSKYGLGSSSAVSVCTVKALSEAFGIKLSRRAIFDLAYQAVLEVQGVGSGFDVGACCFGGVLYYRTGGKEIKFLKNPKIPLVVAYSGKKADTPSMIRKIAQKREKDFRKIENYFDKITDLVKIGRKAIEKRDWRKLGKIMNKNHKILKKLGVSTSKLDKMVKAALDAGALGAKLSGSGGGDCMIALVDEENRHKVEQALVEAGGILVPVSTGVEGVRIER